MAAVVTNAAATTPLIVALYTLAVGVLNGALALRYRTGRRSLTELRLADALTTAVTCWMVAGIMTQLRPATEASVSLQLGVTYVLIARTVLLPSSGRRTLLVCLLALIPVGAVATWLRATDLGREATPNEWLLQGYVAYRSLAITAFLATLTSNVIYGLRRRVHEIARVGQYVLREKLGEGGMGVVYRATHALLRRDTAVKLLLPTRISAEDLARFEREVTSTAQLTHANTVAIFDYGRTPDGVFYYAMEYLEGGDLERLVEYSGPLEPGRAIWILEQVCRALSEAHALGLVHRDIKPSNVLLCERGQEGDVTKILDFGLVKDLNATSAAPVTHDATLTGTPLYMSPESITSPDAVDSRSDLYSLGALAYFLLVGRPPFTGTTIVEICAAHLHVAPEAPSRRRSELPADLDAIVLRCLEKNPATRFADARALREALLGCASAGRWNATSAAAWWNAHRDRFRAHCEARRQSRATAADLAGAETEPLRIDLERRLRGRARSD
ncbi:MAG TPA: serine/threonine-protein kinase [Polyangiales bacterium]|nr:serine/threonine-protein kinase [Polyangiales bacterium]